MDCEPVYFEYADRKWLIEFWKGQYDLTPGCEIGIDTRVFDMGLPGVFSDTFYNSVSNEKLLHMPCSLKRAGAELLRRKDMHWWLTGFRPDEFAEPADLTMDVENHL